MWDIWVGSTVWLVNLYTGGHLISMQDCYVTHSPFTIYYTLFVGGYFTATSPYPFPPCPPNKLISSNFFIYLSTGNERKLMLRREMDADVRGRPLFPLEIIQTNPCSDTFCGAEPRRGCWTATIKWLLTFHIEVGEENPLTIKRYMKYWGFFA